MVTAGGILRIIIEEEAVCVNVLGPPKGRFRVGQSPLECTGHDLTEDGTWVQSVGCPKKIASCTYRNTGFGSCMKDLVKCLMLERFSMECNHIHSSQYICTHLL